MEKRLRYKYASAFMLAFALIMSSCQLGRQYERPELNLPDKLTKQGTTADTTSVADMEWWTIYTGIQ